MFVQKNMDSTIIFGNGINRLSKKTISWGHLLDLIKGTRKFNDGLLPNTMIYERIILERPPSPDDVLYDEFEVKKEIAELMKEIGPNEIYTDLFRLNVKNYITTNYDYSFIYSTLDSNEVSPPIQEFSTEDVYSIRRLKQMPNRYERIKYLWQIHGEIRKPATIMLGLDHYCGSIGKIDSYIKGWYSYSRDGVKIEELSIEGKFKNKAFTNSSWVELFFTTNIHIIGFSLDYSEIDLWWIINKRARMKKSKSLREFIQNKITFHCNDIDEQKKGLLESMDINVKIETLADKNYVEYYQRLLRRFHRSF